MRLSSIFQLIFKTLHFFPFLKKKKGKSELEKIFDSNKYSSRADREPTTVVKWKRITYELYEKIYFWITDIEWTFFRMYSRLAQRTLSATAAVNRIKEWIFPRLKKKTYKKIYHETFSLKIKSFNRLKACKKGTEYPLVTRPYLSREFYVEVLR